MKDLLLTFILTVCTLFVLIMAGCWIALIKQIWELS